MPAIRTRDVLPTLRELERSIGDPYTAHYQPFEFGVFGALMSVTFTVLMLSVGKQLLELEATPLSVFDRVFFFLGLSFGFMLILIILSAAFDRTVSKRARKLFHLGLLAWLAVWGGIIYETRAYAVLETQKQLIDIKLFVGTLIAISALWPVFHVVFRWLARQSAAIRSAR